VWLEVTLFLPAFAVLYHREVLGHAPLWLDLVLIAAGALLGHEGVHRWLAGGDIRQRLWLRIALHSGIVVVLVYALGWGPILVAAFVAVQVVHAPWVGSAAWRPTSVFVILWIVCAQIAVALGWVFVYVDTLQAMGAASLGLLGFAVANRHLGKSIEERERAEAAVRSSEERFRALVQDSNDVICVLDAADASPTPARRWRGSRATTPRWSAQTSAGWSTPTIVSSSTRCTGMHSEMAVMSCSARSVSVTPAGVGGGMKSPSGT
jgi:PAS domain-containing protein